MARPDIATQVRFRKEQELQGNVAGLRRLTKPADQAEQGLAATPSHQNVKILTSCPSCLQGLSRYTDDIQDGLLEADYIVVEMANRLLGKDWMRNYVDAANAGGIERVLV